MGEVDTDRRIKLKDRLAFVKKAAQMGGEYSDAGASALTSGLNPTAEIQAMRQDGIFRDIILQTNAGIQAIMDTYQISREEAEELVQKVIDPRLSLNNSNL